jgi:hypothetical protein
MTNLTKVCTRCKIEKPHSDFYPTKTKSGNPTISSTCKKCSNEVCAIRNKQKRDNRPNVVIENLEGEVWVPVLGYEGKYMVSNLGRVKSLDRWVYRKVVNKDVFVEGKLLAQALSTDGYPMVTLYGETKRDKHPTAVYLIEFWSFNKEIEKVKGFEVDHIDNNKLNSALSNFQYIKTRHNSSKRSMNLRKSSRFTGVSWNQEKGKWQAHIRINSKSKYLGRYDNEIDASIAYQKALQSIENTI